MNVSAFLSIVVVAAFAAVAPARAQGFAGLGADVGGFAQVVPGKALAFPADHGPHPDYRIEWWYVTANLSDETGARYGVQWTLFRQAVRPGGADEGWATQQLWMGHAAVTSATRHRFSEKFARGGVGQAGAEAAPFNAWLDNWTLRSTSQDFAPLELTAAAKDFSYALTLASDRPVVLQGDAGFSRKSEQGQASYYYSQPYLGASGTITIDGKAISVKGQAWIDREWSSQPLGADQTGWDWFSLHMDGGDKLMLFRLRHADGRHFFAGNWISRDGRSEPLDPKGIVLSPTAMTRVAGRDMPTAWDIAVPSRGLKVASVPLNPQSFMDTRFKYWEGPIIVTGSHKGIGYLEMTGY
jgi:predicted secreted hydrolase